ncbi:MAG: zinc ribbon domain-containing protein [Verrucomicrobiota bacterium]
MTRHKLSGTLQQLLMWGTGDPNQIVAGLGVAFLLLAGLWRFVGWVREAPQKPDPWDAEFERRLEAPETQEVCCHCSTPQEPGAWFCKHCGSAVGPYNNLMPYVHIFSEGEVFRNGVTGRFRNRPFIFIGYVLITLGINPIFAPIYWFFLLSNLKHPHNEQESVEDQDVQ